MMILEPPWTVRKMYAADPSMTITAATYARAYAHLSNLFSFGAVAIEVRPVYLAAYSVGDGEMDNEFCLRFLQESLRLINPRTWIFFQSSRMVHGRIFRKEQKNWV